MILWAYLTNQDIRPRISARHAHLCERKNVFLSFFRLDHRRVPGRAQFLSSGKFDIFRPVLRDGTGGLWVGELARQEGKLESGDDLFLFGEPREPRGKWRTTVLVHVWLCFLDAVMLVIDLGLDWLCLRMCQSWRSSLRLASSGNTFLRHIFCNLTA